MASFRCAEVLGSKYSRPNTVFLNDPIPPLNATLESNISRASLYNSITSELALPVAPIRAVICLYSLAAVYPQLRLVGIGVFE